MASPIFKIWLFSVAMWRDLNTLLGMYIHMH